MRIQTAIVIVIIAQGLVACDTSNLPPTAPSTSPAANPSAAGLVAFRDPAFTNGFYEIRGLFDGVEQVSTVKDGYESTTRSVSITGDTRFDIQIVRR